MFNNSVDSIILFPFVYFEYRNVVGYEGDKNREDIIRKVFVIYMRGASIGLQSICHPTRKCVANKKKGLFSTRKMP